MTKQEEQTFKRLIEEGTLGVLESREGQEAIKKGSLNALGSKEGREILAESFVENYKELIEPTLEDMWDDIRQLKTEVKHMKEKNDLRFQRLERKAGVAT